MPRISIVVVVDKSREECWCCRCSVVNNVGEMKWEERKWPVTLPLLLAAKLGHVAINCLTANCH